MPRFYVKDNSDNWNIFSTIMDDYIFNEFKEFSKMKEFILKERERELDSLLTDRPELNIISKATADEIIRNKEF